jgi:PAS domain S-box-containing protein
LRVEISAGSGEFLHPVNCGDQAREATTSAKIAVRPRVLQAAREFGLRTTGYVYLADGGPMPPKPFRPGRKELAALRQRSSKTGERMSNAAANDPGFAWADDLRPQAERPADETNLPELLPEADLRTLVGELQLRQSELERENEALRHAHGAAGDSSGKYDHLFNAMHMACFVLDRDGTILAANQAAAELLGVNRDDLAKKPLKAFVPPEERSVFEAFLSRVAHADATKQTGKFAILRNEETVCVLVVGIAERADDGAVSECKLAMIEVNEIMKIDSALGEREMLYRSIVENVNIGITFIDAEHTIVKTNPAQAQMFGKDVEVFCGKKCFQEYEKRHQVCPHCPGTRAMWTGKPAQVETVGIRDDGSRFTARVKAVPMFGPDRIVNGFIEVVEDITEQKRTEDRLREFAALVAAKNRALEEHAAALEAATYAKDEFLSNMSHELRTPLNAIIGFSEGLLERTDRFPLNDHQKDRISRIRISGEQLLTLINGVLDIAKIESGKLQLNLLTFEIEDLVDELRGIAEVLLKSKPEVQFTLDVGEGISTITSDHDKLRRILINLLSNAVKFTRRGSVSLGVHRIDQSLVVEVADTGIGIPQQYTDRVFDKFFQVPGVRMDRSLKGSGLGLSICRAYAQMLGGSLSMRSLQWKGSTFTLTVPLTLQLPDASASEAGAAATLEPNRSQAIVVEHPKILCIQADSSSMTLLTDHLAEVGCEVFCTTDGTEATAMAVKDNVELIILNLILPNVDGWKVLHELKMNPVTGHIPVLIVTSLDEEAMALRLGAAAYLRQPVNRSALLKAVEYVLSRNNRYVRFKSITEKSLDRQPSVGMTP